MGKYLTRLCVITTGDNMPFTKAKARKIVKEVIMPKLPKHPGKIRKLTKAIESELETHKKVTDLIKRAKGMNKEMLELEISSLKSEINRTRKDLVKQYGIPTIYGTAAGYEFGTGLTSAGAVGGVIGGVLGTAILFGGGVASGSVAKGKTLEILREQKKRKIKLKTLKDLKKLSPEEIDELIKIREEREKAVEKIIESLREEAEKLEKKKAKKRLAKA